MSLAPVPTLDELAADPMRGAALPAEVRRALTLRCAAVLTALAESATPTEASPAFPAEDRLLTADVFSARVCLSVYRG